jgi:hypothetical protein
MPMHAEDQPIVRARRECKRKGAAVQYKYTARAQDESGSQGCVLHPGTATLLRRGGQMNLCLRNRRMRKGPTL